MILTSRYYVHIHVDYLSPSGWFFTIVYASPHSYQHETVWRELIELSTSVSGPWYIAGDFNQVLFTHEKQGGAPFHSSASNSFAHCINACHLVDLGFQGQPFT